MSQKKISRRKILKTAGVVYYLIANKLLFWKEYKLIKSFHHNDTKTIDAINKHQEQQHN